MSEALIFASTNPQYDDRLLIELQVQYMKIPSSNLGRTCWVQKLALMFRTIFVRSIFSPCSAKRRASDEDLPVIRHFCLFSSTTSILKVRNKNLGRAKNEQLLRLNGKSATNSLAIFFVRTHSVYFGVLQVHFRKPAT